MHNIFREPTPNLYYLISSTKETLLQALKNYTKHSQGQIHSTVDTSNILRVEYTELTTMAVTT